MQTLSTGPRKRVRRKERTDAIAPKIVARDLVHRQVLFNPTENSVSHEESLPRGREFEAERSTWPHRRIAGRRAVEDETSSAAKKERVESTDLSLFRSPSEFPLPSSDDAMGRLRHKRQAENSSDQHGKRVREDGLAVVPWSDPSGVKRSLDVDDEEQQKKQCTGERSEQGLSLPPPLPDDGDEILWCELVEHDNEILAEWTAEIEGPQEVTTEQLLQGAAKKGNEKGSNVLEKSLIWAAKDTEWKKLEEKGAVRILSGASAEKAKAQFGDRFIPSRFVVTRPGLEEFKARWCLRRYLDPDVMELARSGATQSPTVSQLGRMLSCQMIVSSGWDLQLGDVPGAFWRQTLWIGRKDRCTQVFLQGKFQGCLMDRCY